MNIYGNSAVKASYDSGSCPSLSASPPCKTLLVEEEAVEYATIDGEVITSKAGTNALKIGAGIMIGDYFVGISESISAFGNTPYLRY